MIPAILDSNGVVMIVTVLVQNAILLSSDLYFSSMLLLEQVLM